MKIANIVLAALVIVAAPAFANTAAVQVSEQAVAAAVNRLSTTQIQSAARALNAPSATTAQALTAAIMTAINNKQISAAALIDSKSKKVTVSDTYIHAAKVAANATQMPDRTATKQNSGGVLNDTASDVRRGGSDIGSVNDYRPARGEEEDRSLDSLRNHCSADGKAAVFSGGCGKLPAEAQAVWNRVFDGIIAGLKAINITTTKQLLANKAKATEVIKTAYSNATSSKTCEAIKNGLLALSAPASASNENCEVIRRDVLDQGVLAACAH